MNVITRGVRNAFRNLVRSFSIIITLGLSIGLCLVMLIAHQAVGQKINDVKASVGNAITITPAGFSAFSQANNALTSPQLSKVKSLAHVTGLTETLTDRLTTIGSSQPSFGFGEMSSGSSGNNNQTSLTSPVKINLNRNGSGNGRGYHLFINGGGSLPSNFSPPVTIIGTTDPQTLNQQNGNSAKLVSGKFINGGEDTNNAMVSTNMANKNNLKVGSTFTAYGTTLTVAGIFDTGTQGGNDAVIVSLPTEQRLSGQSGDVTNAVATVDSLDNLASATSAIKNQLGSSADVVSSQDQANNAIKPLQNVQSISLISLIGAVIAGAVIVLLVMVMIVRERRREIGILKAIGASNVRVIFQFMSEAVTLTLAGAIIGILIGVVGGSPVTNTLVTNSTTSSSSFSESGGPRTFSRFGNGGGSGPVFRRPAGGFLNRGAGSIGNTLSNIRANVGWSILLYGLGAALLIAIIGSSLAGWLIAKVSPAEVMRVE